jgi:hypothetical protein
MCLESKTIFITLNIGTYFFKNVRNIILENSQKNINMLDT